MARPSGDLSSTSCEIRAMANHEDSDGSVGGATQVATKKDKDMDKDKEKHRDKAKEGDEEEMEAFPDFGT